MRKKKEKKILSPKKIIALVVVAAIVSITCFVYFSQPDDVDKLSMTYAEILDADALKRNVKTMFKQDYELNDYTVYGENMMLYEEPYTSESTDGLLGKNVVLRNIETDQEVIFTFSGGVDSGIDLSTLDEGMYEVYVYDHYKKKRVFFSDEFTSDQFTTIRRNDVVKYVTLNTEKDYLKDIDVTMDKNYAFITVIDNLPVASIYDVVIDPSALVLDISDNSVDNGYQLDNFVEADESYDLAVAVKNNLEAKGLRVKLTRDDQTANSYYGSEGRAGIGYESQAKIFLSLQTTSDDTIVYPYMIASPYTSALLENEMAYYMKQKGLNMTAVSDETRLQSGVMFDSYIQSYTDEDGLQNTQYELYPQLRETGGKSTFAGEMEGCDENQIYKDSYGMYSVIFTYANANLKESIKYYQNNKEQIAQCLSDGICQYFNIE